MGVLKRNEKRCKGRRDSISTLLKLLFISSLFLFVLMYNATIMGDGFFIVDEVNSILINEGEPGTVLCIQDDLLYVSLINYTEGEGYSNIIQIIDVHQPENPVVVGSYELGVYEYLLDFKIRENIAYMLTELWYIIGQWGSVALLDITDPTNPVRIGSSTPESIRYYRVNRTDRIGIYKNYTYVSSWELLIFDCSNRTLPVRVGSYPSSLGDVHVENDYLYLVSNGVTIYSLADPVNPVFLGAVESTKGFSVRSGVYGNYVISAFRDAGIQVYDCTDPTQPTICGDYSFPNWQLYIEGNIQDMEIVGDRVFAGGNELYVFDISKPQKLKRMARLKVGDQNLSQITVANNYMYLTFPSSIRIYSYVENSLGRNFGLVIGIGLPIVIVGSILIVRKKKKS